MSTPVRLVLGSTLMLFLELSRPRRKPLLYSLAAVLAYVGLLTILSVCQPRTGVGDLVHQPDHFPTPDPGFPPLIFLTSAAIMAGPGQLVADCFSQLCSWTPKYLLLFGGLALARLTPAAWVLSLPLPLRLTVAVLMADLPIMA